MNRVIRKTSFLTGRARRGLGLMVQATIRTRTFKRFGAGTEMHRPQQITNPGNISIGSNVFIRSGARIDAIRGDNGTQFDPHIEIQDGSQIENRIHVTCIKSVVIGRNSLIASNVFISDHGHEYQDISLPVKDQGLTQPAPVVIGEGGWIGQNCIIMPGTHLGKHCIVGSNSVVKGTFPDYSVIAGAPAKIIKRYDSNSKEWKSV